jgi:DNA-binding IclR family transcriptional regulator
MIMASTSDPIETKASQQSSSAAGTVARTVRLLAAIADSKGTVGVGTLADAVGLPASTVHRLLKLLTEEGIVDRDANTHNYAVGPELYRISARIISKVDTMRVIRPHLQRLASSFNETVLFGQYSATTRSLSFSARADGSQLLQYRIELNQPTSLVWGASGKAVLAYLEPEEVSQILEYEKAQTGNGRAPGDNRELPERRALEAELQEVRDRGYAVSEAEKLPQARGIGVPVFGPSGILGSVTLTSPRDRLPHGEIAAIGEALLTTANKISSDLGGTPQTKTS